MPESQYTWIDDPQYSVRAMSESVAQYTNTYGRLQEIGLFSERPVFTTNVDIEIKNFDVSLIASSERYSPAQRGRSTKGKKRPISIPHFSVDDQINADELQNALPFGAKGSWDFAVLDDLVLEVHDRLSMDHFITHEYMMWGALKGIVLDADGVELFNVNDFFGVPRPEFDFKFASAADANPIHTISAQINDHFVKNARGEFVRGAHAFCSRLFFDRLVTHPEIKDDYKYYSSIQDPNRTAIQDFYHKGITYEVHVGEAVYNQPDGTPRTDPFIPPGEAIIVPLGTRQTFRTFVGPATGLNNVNKLGQMLYSRVLPDPSGRDDFVSIDTQSNCLPIVCRPKLVGRLFSST